MTTMMALVNMRGWRVSDLAKSFVIIQQLGTAGNWTKVLGPPSNNAANDERSLKDPIDDIGLSSDTEQNFVELVFID